MFADECFNRLDRYILGKARASLELEHGKVSNALHLLKQALQVCLHAAPAQYHFTQVPIVHKTG